MYLAFWITKAANKHSEYGFLWQQWLRERSSMLHYT